MARGWIFLLLREMCLGPPWLSIRYISGAAKYRETLAGLLSSITYGIGQVGETSGSVAYAKLDFMEDMQSLLSFFLQLARLTTV